MRLTLALLIFCQFAFAGIYVELKGMISGFDEKSVTVVARSGNRYVLPRSVIPQELELRPGRRVIIPLTNRQLAAIEKFRRSRKSSE